MLYSTPALLARLGAETGYSSLEFRLADTSKAAADRTVAAARGYLTANTSFTGFSDLPAAAQAGRYPGKDSSTRSRLDHERVHGAGAAGRRWC